MIADDARFFGELDAFLGVETSREEASVTHVEGHRTSLTPGASVGRWRRERLPPGHRGSPGGAAARRHGALRIPRGARCTASDASGARSIDAVLARRDAAAFRRRCSCYSDGTRFLGGVDARARARGWHRGSLGLSPQRNWRSPAWRRRSADRWQRSQRRPARSFLWAMPTCVITSAMTGAVRRCGLAQRAVNRRSQWLHTTLLRAFHYDDVTMASRSFHIGQA